MARESNICTRVDKGQGFSLSIRSRFYFIFFRAVRQGTQEAAVLYEILKEGNVLKQETVGWPQMQRLETDANTLNQSKVIYACMCVFVCMVVGVGLCVHMVL